MKKVWFIVVALVVCIAAGAITGVVVGRKSSKHKNVLETIGDMVGKKQKLEIETIEEIVKPAGDLVTQRYFYTDVDTYENYKEILGAKVPLTTDKTVFSYRGTVSVGIVLSQVKFEVDELNNRILITLPPVFIVSNEIDPDSFQTYEIKNSVFTETKLGGYAELLGKLKLKKQEQILADTKFMNSAVEETKVVINGFLKASDLARDYKIEYR